jgi:hypothetical protein
MGSTHSSPQKSTNHENLTIDSEFNDLWNQLTNEETITEETLINYLNMYDRVLVHLVFRFISLGNPQITKLFMLSRIRDMREDDNPARTGSHRAQFWTLLDATHFSCREILKVTLMDASVDIEIESFRTLRIQFPNLESIVHSVILSVLFKRTHPMDLAQVTDSSKIVMPKIFRRLRLLLPTTITETPQLLFSSQTGGMSYRALVPALKYYPGGLIFLFQGLSGELFGSYADRSEWVDTQGYDESAKDSFLFELSPTIRIRIPNRVGSRNFVYMNTMPSSTRPFGIGFGGREGSFRVWINGSDLTKIMCMESDATFESGYITSGSEEGTVEVRNFELWGVGGNEATLIQAKHRESEDSNRQDRRRVDKTRLVENQFDREVLFANTFKNQQDGGTRLGS